MIKDDGFASPRKLLYEFFALRITFFLKSVIQEISFVFSRDFMKLETSRVEADDVFFASHVLHLHFLNLTFVVPLCRSSLVVS